MAHARVRTSDAIMGVQVTRRRGHGDSGGRIAFHDRQRIELRGGYGDIETAPSSRLGVVGSEGRQLRRFRGQPHGLFGQWALKQKMRKCMMPLGA